MKKLCLQFQKSQGSKRVRCVRVYVNSVLRFTDEHRISTTDHVDVEVPDSAEISLQIGVRSFEKAAPSWSAPTKFKLVDLPLDNVPGVLRIEAAESAHEAVPEEFNSVFVVEEDTGEPEPEFEDAETATAETDSLESDSQV